MQYFYEELADHKSKDEALRQAKLKFLNEDKHRAFAHPNYWAGFVMIGNTNPVEVASSTNLTIPLVLLLATGFMLWVLRFVLKTTCLKGPIEGNIALKAY